MAKKDINIDEILAEAESKQIQDLKKDWRNFHDAAVWSYYV